MMEAYPLISLSAGNRQHCSYLQKAKSGERFDEDFPGLPPWAYPIGSDAAFTNYVHLCAHSILPINSVTHLTCALL